MPVFFLKLSNGLKSLRRTIRVSKQHHIGTYIYKIVLKLLCMKQKCDRKALPFYRIFYAIIEFCVHLSRLLVYASSLATFMAPILNP